jgi:hypothetical protein
MAEFNNFEIAAMLSIQSQLTNNYNITNNYASDAENVIDDEINKLSPKSVETILIANGLNDSVSEFMDAYEEILPEEFTLNSDSEGYWFS